MMMIEEILKIINEAQKRNYPDHVLKYDLQNLMDRYEDKVAEKHSFDYEDGYSAGYTDAEEEFEYHGFDDGKEEGIAEARKQFIETLADKLIELKLKIKDRNLQGKELQLALTEILLELDEDDELIYTNREDKLKCIDGNNDG